MKVLSTLIEYLQAAFITLLAPNWIPVIISGVALTLSIVNAKMTWGKPFTFEFYPSLQGMFKENEDLLYTQLKATYYNSGSKAGLITEVALVQLDENRIVEKCPLIEIIPITTSDIPIAKLLNNPIYDKPIDHTFFGLFLEPQKIGRYDSTFRLLLQRKHTNRLEKWNIAYRLSSENRFRLANVEIHIAISEKRPGQNNRDCYRKILKVTNGNYKRKKLVDTLPEIGVGLG